MTFLLDPHTVSEIIGYLTLFAVAVGTIGEAYAHLIPDRVLPNRLKANEAFKERIAKACTFGLVVAVIVAIPATIISDRINDTAFEQLQGRVQNIDTGLGGRHLTQSQKDVLGSVAGAQIAIISEMLGESDDFARELGRALHVPNSSISGGNTMQNGSLGLVVVYDHSNPVSVSVFAALAQAQLEPKDGGDSPGATVFIKVYPKQSAF